MVTVKGPKGCLLYTSAITDKTNNRFGFIVRPEANKLEIKKEVEALYNVTVVDVNTMTVSYTHLKTY